MRFQVMGLRGEAGFDRLVEHFRSLGGDCVLVDPSKIAGAGHLMSAALHGERAFAEGTNRSDSVLTEIIMYAAWERQIGKALKRMRPRPGPSRRTLLLQQIPSRSMSPGLKRSGRRAP